MHIVKAQPAAVSAAVVATLNALVLLNVMDLNGDQISAINIAAVALLGLFVQQSVTPVSKVVSFTSKGRVVAGPASSTAAAGSAEVDEAAA